MNLRSLIPLLAGVFLFSNVSANTLEQRLQKVERQMSRLSALMLEIQQLREDLQQNYGAVEEVLHQQRELKKRQSEQYLDLDARLRKLEKGGEHAPTVDRKTVSAGQQGGEYEAYNKAFALVRANKTSEALDALNKLIQDYPKGEYTGDAWYWIGRLHTVKSEQKLAKRAFAQARVILNAVVKQQPGSQQAERAAAKLKKIP